MDSLEVAEVLPKLNATQLKSLLKLLDCPFGSKLKITELLEIAMARKDITVPIIVNFLKLDVEALQKKVNRVSKQKKIHSDECSKCSKSKTNEVSFLIEDNLSSEILEST